MTGARRVSGPRGGGAPVSAKVLYTVALGLADVGQHVERPREVRAPGTSQAMTAREMATAMQTLAMIGNVFARAVPPATAAEIRGALLDIYVDAGLVELPPVECDFGEAS